MKSSKRSKNSVIFQRFSSSPGFNRNRTLGEYKSLPKAPPKIKQEVFSFHEKDTKDNILFSDDMVNGRPQIKAGTLEKLVQRMTHEDYLDPIYTQTFLLTYRTFTTPNQLLNILKARYHMKPPKQAPKDWADKIQKPIRLRVFNALKNWLLKGFYDFADSPKLRKNLLNFLDDMAVEMAFSSKNLRNVFDRQMNEARKGRAIIHSKAPPIPILPRSLVAKPTLIDFNAVEVARQLTVIESELYRAVKPWELLSQAWAKKDKEKRAPRVLAMIERFNIVSNWIATIIVQTKDLKLRVALFKHIIDIAHECLILNNFNAVMEIISGLQASSVFRLKQTRGQIDSKHLKMLEECETIMCRDQNFKNFRACLHSRDPPSIPYLGVYLTDLTFIEDGNNDNINGLINVVKRQQVFSVISEIQQYQYAPYCLEKVEFICDWLLDVNAITEDECYKISVQIEPKGSKAPETKRRMTLSKQTSHVFRKGSVLSPKNSNTHVGEQIENPYSSPYGELEIKKDYLYYDKDSSSNIITEKIGEQNIIKGGTVVKLIERLTHEKFPDTSYMGAFLLTYRTFTTPSEFLDMLINRFNMPVPKSPTKEQEKNFRAEKQIPIRFRVFNVLKDWTITYGLDFKQDTVLVQRVVDFANNVISEHTSLATAAKGIITTLNSQLIKPKEPKIIQLGCKSNSNIESIESIDIDILAEQISSFTFSTFGNTEPREYTQGLWKETEGRFKCVHLHRLYNFTVSFSNWIKTELFTAPDVTTRALRLEKFIHMADKFSKLKNLQDCFTIITTLDNVREKELQITWEWLSPRYISVWSRLKRINTKPEKEIKLQTKSRSHTKINPISSVPYITSILEKIEDINKMPDTISEFKLVNFEKRQKIYDECFPLVNFIIGCGKVEQKPINEDIHTYLKSVHILSQKELEETSKNMNNERPEGVPPSEQEKNALVSITEGFIDESIKPLLLQLIAKDNTFREFIINQLTEQIQSETVEKVKQEMIKFATVGKLLLSLVLTRKNHNKPKELEISKEIAKIIFPSSKIEIWSKVDTNSSVFGWEEEISLLIMENEEEKTIVDTRFHASKADISTLMRLQQFYQEENDDDTSTLCSIIVMEINEAALGIASSNNINVIKL